MFLMFVTVLLLTATISEIEADYDQLCEAINYYSKGSMLFCLVYSDYGCWCGPGGSGPPVDGTDACCRTHDLCYETIVRNETCDPYHRKYKVEKGKCCKCSVITNKSVL